MTNAEKNIVDFLKNNGYDGLFNADRECACDVGALCPCGECFAECEPGYREEGCTCGQGCDYHIVRDKPRMEKPPLDEVDETDSLGVNGYLGSGG